MGRGFTSPVALRVSVPCGQRRLEGAGAAASSSCTRTPRVARVPAGPWVGRAPSTGLCLWPPAEPPCVPAGRAPGERPLSSNAQEMLGEGEDVGERPDVGLAAGLCYWPGGKYPPHHPFISTKGMCPASSCPWRRPELSLLLPPLFGFGSARQRGSCLTWLRLIQAPPGQGPLQPTVGDPASAGGWAGRPPEVPSNPQHSVIL